MNNVVRRALISVSDKTGLTDFARALAARGIELVSTGGSAQSLRDAGLAVREVSELTGFPEMMDGRVKTLHPKVHGGILARRDLADHREALDRHGILPIDLVVVNLYPFAATVAKPHTLDDAIENIDIGGPALIRAAAKNHAFVTVVVSPADYATVLKSLGDNAGALPAGERFRLAAKAYSHTAAYDGMIANYLEARDEQGAATPFGRTWSMQFERAQGLRYGENPHQAAAFYREARPAAGTITSARVLAGKELSFNNIADADAAIECVKQFDAPACVIVKHANPCGVAVADDIHAAYKLAFQTDPTSAFGGIIAFNHTLEAATAREILDRQFVEVVIAPEIAPEALAVFNTKPGVRVLATGAWPDARCPGFDSPGFDSPSLDYRRVTGGLLIQDCDRGLVREQDLKRVTQREPTAQELADLLFAWRVAKFVKSNAIVYAREGRTLGVGAGQMSRVVSAKIASLKAAEAGLVVRGAVMASDAFFPFRDGLDQAAESGITAVIQPGGSMRDAEVIQAADEHGMAMVFTGMRHFRH